jgi:hypothetical protein
MKKPGRYQFSGVGSHRANAWRPGGGLALIHLANAAARLSIDSWPTTLRVYRYAVRPTARRTVRSQAR